jgi:hypothetical protein
MLTLLALLALLQAYGVLWEPEPVVLQCRACYKQFGFFR